MRKLTYAEKPRIALRTSKVACSATYIDTHGRFWRGVGSDHTAAFAALYRLMRKHNVRLQPRPYEYRLPTCIPEGMKDGPDIGLGPSDYVATSNLPWWRRLFRI